MSKCTTHINGAKCELKLDAHFKSVELSGIGYKKWRNLRFSRIVLFLFKRVMQEMDSIVEEPIKSEQRSVELTDLNSNDNQTTSGQCDVNDNVAPKCNVSQSDDALNCSYELPNEANNGSVSETTSDPERDAFS